LFEVVENKGLEQDFQEWKAKKNSKLALS